MDSKKYRKLLKEISDGYSGFFVNEKRRFIKHQATDDLVDFDDVYEMYFNRAISKGLPSEEQIFEDLKEEGEWTEKEEAEIESQSFYVENLIKNKKNIVLKSAMDQVNKQIKEGQDKLKELKDKKQSLIRNSADQYALNRANDFYIFNSFYKDEKLETRLYTQEEFEYASTKEVTDLVKIYNKFHANFSEENIQHLAIQDFYKVYYHFSENSIDFFGKPILELTNFQLNLILYTRIFKNIFEQNENIPERLKKDPAGLLDYANSAESREKLKQQVTEKDSGASTIVGATKEDMAELGMETTGRSLNEIAKEKGTLSMKDLMDMSGS